MKKLTFLLSAVFITAFSAATFAQGSGEAPEIGSTHQYWVNGTFGTPTQGATSNYTWWISDDTSDLKNRISDTSPFTVTGGATYDNPTGGSGGGTGIELVWNPSSAGNTYYLVVEENDGTCSNIKAVAIQPVNAFDIIFAAIDESDSDDDNPSQCAPDIALTASGTTITYNYGTGEYKYKITSSGLYSDWTFNFAFNNTVGSATPTISYSTDDATYTAEGAATGSKTVTPANGAATVYFKVSLDNGTAEEGLSDQTMVLTLTNISDGSNAPAHIYMSDGSTEFTGDIEQTQTVTARPNTTGISSN